MHEYICTVDIFFRPYYLSENPCPSSYQCLDGSCISWSNTCSKTPFCVDGTNTPSVCGKSDLQHWTDHLRLMSYVLHSIMRPTPGNSERNSSLTLGSFRWPFHVLVSLKGLGLLEVLAWSLFSLIQ